MLFPFLELDAYHHRGLASDVRLYCTARVCSGRARHPVHIPVCTRHLSGRLVHVVSYLPTYHKMQCDSI